MMISEFIGKWLTLKPGEDAGICVICGRETTTGTKTNNIISSSFNDWANMRHRGTIVCEYCAACLSNTAFDGKALRSYSLIITEHGLTKASRKDILEAIIFPPFSPYLLIVNYSQKKHAWFSAVINDPHADVIYVGTDQGALMLERDSFCEAFSKAMDLYCGGFSKADIDLSNTSKFNKIEQYGVEKYYSDMSALDKIRNTKAMQLLIWALHKEQEESNDQT